MNLSLSFTKDIGLFLKCFFFAKSSVFTSDVLFIHSVEAGKLKNT